MTLGRKHCRENVFMTEISHQISVDSQFMFVEL
jgi:hypothetical protein